jgi:hypothetical protein
MIRSDASVTCYSVHMLEVLAASLLIAVSPTAAASPTPPPDPCGAIMSVVSRPTVTNAVCTVRPGQALLENGWSNTITTGTGDGNTASYPQSLLKLGTINPHLDLEIGLPNITRTTVGGAYVAGVTDVNFGAKYELGYSAKVVWGVAGLVSVPSGDTAFTAGESTYTLGGNWSYTLTSLFALAGTVNLNALAGPDATGTTRRYSSIAPSVVFEATPSSFTTIFAEYAYTSHAGYSLPGRTTLDAGVSADLTPHFQFDVEAGWLPTLIQGQRQHYVGAGLSIMY